MGKLILSLCSITLLVSSVWAQNAPPAASADTEKSERRKGPGAAKNIGVGAAKGAGDAAKGVGKGAVDLVTLHPINAATAIGKGAASTGKDVTVGTAKGTGKIARGIGKAFKKIF